MKPQRRRRLGVALGAVAGLALVTWLRADGQAQLHAPGPMNARHDDLDCESCHVEADGTLRQQLQTAAKGTLGFATADVDLGYRAVTSERCVACHDRPDDRHPIGRFLEPRFTEARATLGPERCGSCHREHSGTRITVGDSTFCRHCHATVALANDPVDVSHRQLAEQQRWDTCLGCHDYHGNHALHPPQRLSLAIGLDRLRAYFEGGESPYPAPVRRATVLP
ncbi:MAG: cytochrome c3 family protein [Deltaproteobacteria bacterium]|nr:cytochrome c3 family protein [Deltaproteobacteria bacterium]